MIQCMLSEILDNLNEKRGHSALLIGTSHDFIQRPSKGRGRSQLDTLSVSNCPLLQGLIGRGLFLVLSWQRLEDTAERGMNGICFPSLHLLCTLGTFLQGKTKCRRKDC